MKSLVYLVFYKYLHACRYYTANLASKVLGVTWSDYLQQCIVIITYHNNSFPWFWCKVQQVKRPIQDIKGISLSTRILIINLGCFHDT